jgi:hypothetical protein
MSGRLAAGSFLLLLAGCGVRTTSPPTPAPPETAAHPGRVTLHVKEMTKLLNIG